MSSAPLVVETYSEVAERLGFSVRTIHNLVKEGLPSRKIGRSRRFIAAEVDAWLLERES